MKYFNMHLARDRVQQTTFSLMEILQCYKIGVPLALT